MATTGKRRTKKAAAKRTTSPAKRTAATKRTTAKRATGTTAKRAAGATATKRTTTKRTPAATRGATGTTAKRATASKRATTGSTAKRTSAAKRTATGTTAKRSTASKRAATGTTAKRSTASKRAATGSTANRTSAAKRTANGATAKRAAATTRPTTAAKRGTKSASTATTTSATRSSTIPKPALPVERFTLGNGLRVVLSQDRSAPTVAITVNYDVGFRSEPEGRTGFAHLFEHLMFQGSANLEKGEADKLIEGNGGVMNGSTRSDYTNYISMLPSNALELGLFLEADRMRSTRIDEENLQNQIDVVKEEIRVNVLNRPYGGFPWIDLPPIMFETFNNAHNGYGSFVDLESATVADAQDFFDTFYAPANAQLSVTGDFDVAKITQLVERHFGDIKKRKAPKVPDVSEPLPTKERRATKYDAMAPMPALAAGYRVPDPLKRLDEYLAAVVLTEVLTDGEGSRLHQRLVKRDRVASHIGGMVGTFGDPFDVRDPTMLQLLAYHPGATAPQVLAAIDDEIERLADEGIDQEEVDRVVTSLVSGHLRRLDNLLQRSMFLATLEQQRSRAELVNELPELLAAVTTNAVVDAASRWLEPKTRAVLEVRPGTGEGE